MQVYNKVQCISYYAPTVAFAEPLVGDDTIWTIPSKGSSNRDVSLNPNLLLKGDLINKSSGTEVRKRNHYVNQ